jgi:hypothetical protein
MLLARLISVRHRNTYGTRLSCRIASWAFANGHAFLGASIRFGIDTPKATDVRLIPILRHANAARGLR